MKAKHKMKRGALPVRRGENPPANYTGVVCFLDEGHHVYFENGVVHRTSGPAIITRRSVEYHVNGELHRLDGPSMIIKRDNKVFLCWNICGHSFRSENRMRKFLRHIKKTELFSPRHNKPRMIKC